MSFIVIKVKIDTCEPFLQGEFKTYKDALEYIDKLTEEDKKENDLDNSKFNLKKNNDSKLYHLYEREDNYVMPNKNILKFNFKIIPLKNKFCYCDDANHSNHFNDEERTNKDIKAQPILIKKKK